MRTAHAALIGISLLALAPTLAVAADLPSRVSSPQVYAAPPPIPVFTWTGFHGGINAGYAFDMERATKVNVDRDGFAGGGQIGYDYQFQGLALGTGGVVIGAEADAQYLDVTGAGQKVGGTFYRDASSDRFFGTVRGRLGYTFDRVLAYGTGGFGYTGHRTGYTFGGGLAYAATANWVLTAEYLRVNLENDYTTYRTGPTVNVSGGRQDFNVVRGKVDYRFDSFGALTSFSPVSARF